MIPRIPLQLLLNPEPFVIAHQVHVDLEPSTGRLSAIDTVSLSRLPASGVARFRFMSRLHVDALTAAVPVTWHFANGRLDVRMPAACGALPQRFTVRYHGTVPAAGGVTLLAEDWWVPSNVGEQGDSRLTVMVPASDVVAASGSPQPPGPDGRTWTLPAGHPGIALVAGRYQVSHYRLHGLPINVYLWPQSHPVPAAELAGRADAAIQYFVRQWGPYPYDKLDILEQGTGTQADTEPSLIRMAPQVLASPKLLDDYVPHEVSHSWWSNAIEGYSPDSLWFEPFAETSSDLYRLDHGQAGGVRQERHDTLVAWTKHYGARGSTPIARLVNYEGAEVEDVAYNKGCFMMSMLRDEIGDHAYRHGLRIFAHTWTGRFPTWSDIEVSFEQASSRDLSWFFTQWLERGDAANLSLQHLSIQRTASGWTVHGDLHQQGQPYRLQVPLRIGATKRTIATTTKDQTFDATTPTYPRVVLDPDERVFRLINVARSR